MTQEHWKSVWNHWPSKFGSTEYLRQVGKTTNGKPITEEQIDLFVAELVRKLRLEPSDILLDLCCGNGLLTSRLAAHCQRVVGIDFSTTLLNVARQSQIRENIDYHLGSVLEMDEIQLPSVTFTKVLMNEALQYFTPADLTRLLIRLKGMIATPRLILFANVLYQPRRGLFWAGQTPSQRREDQPCGRQDLLGHWWNEVDVLEACLAAGLECQVQHQRSDLYNAAFRVDVAVW
jgi:SAM-dependent methyltransferase